MLMLTHHQWRGGHFTKIYKITRLQKVYRRFIISSFEETEGSLFLHLRMKTLEYIDQFQSADVPYYINYT